MFKFLQRQYPNKISGEIERIGILPSSEDSLNYVFKLVGCPIIFEFYVKRGNVNKGIKKIHVIALTKEGDEIFFNYDKYNKVESDNFKNLSYSV